MRLDFAERLRCPRSHAPTPLVVVSRRKRGRELLEGFAGCPVCQLEVPIVEGHVRFEGIEPAPAGRAPELDRLIALLGLAEPEGAVLLTGRYALIAESLAESTGVHAIVMHAAKEWPANELMSAVLGVLPLVPFTDATFRGAALDSGTPSALAVDAVRVVQVGGRVVGDAAMGVPAGLRAIARDDQEWVASREPIGPMVALRRRGDDASP